MTATTPQPQLQLPANLQEALIPTLPPSMYYIPDFISPAEEAHLLAKIHASPRPHWHRLSHRRLQAHPSPLTPGTNTLLAAPLPSWLADPIVPRLLSVPCAASTEDTHAFSASPHRTPNHCLVNEYAPGQGILAHEDGPAYWPVVATVSLGAPIVLDVYAKGDGRGRSRWRVLQERRSLLVTAEQMYGGWLHGIEEGVEVDERLGEVVNWGLLGRKGDFGEGKSVRGTRVSLTFRDVIRVKNLGKGLGFVGR